MKKLKNFDPYHSRQDDAALRAERQRLGQLSVEQLRVELETKLKARLIDEIELIPTVVANKVADVSEQLLLALVGLKKDTFSNKFEIDINNRNVALAHEIGERILVELALATPGFFLSLAPAGSLHKKVKTAYQRAYTSAFNELLYQRVNEAASENAEQMLKVVMDEVQTSFDLEVSSQEKKEDT